MQVVLERGCRDQRIGNAELVAQCVFLEQIQEDRGYAGI
jgi:hypothetical protein